MGETSGRLVGILKIDVVNLEIVALKNMRTGQLLDSTYFDHVETIDGMFDVIYEAYRDDADLIAISYAHEGFPSKINIDWRIQSPDDWLTLGVSDVTLAVQTSTTQ